MKYMFIAVFLLVATATVTLAAPTHTLTVAAYVDLNGNGLQDGNDPPAAGIDWVATDDRSIYRCSTSASGTCTLTLTPGRWHITAYRNFDMVFDGDMQLDGDMTVSAGIAPEVVYLPIAVK